VNRRRIRFTATAQRHAQREKEWWLANRDEKAVFADEIEHALQILEILPAAGSKYGQSRTPGLRRVYLEKIDCHLYYTFDDSEVLVRALWGARRRRGHKIHH